MFDKESIDSLRASFPPEAIQIYKEIKDPKDNSIIKTLVGFKPQYIIERLNDTFGHDGWDFEVLQLDIKENCAYCWGRLTVYSVRQDENNINSHIMRGMLTKKEQVGSCELSDKITYGDALKGSVTNCIEKCASLFDIGHEAYKGLLSSVGSSSPTKAKTKIENAISLDDLKKELRTLCTENKITGETAKSQLIKNVLGKDIKDKDSFTAEDYEKLIHHVKVHKTPF